jgi:hypothetical protein
MKRQRKTRNGQSHDHVNRAFVQRRTKTKPLPSFRRRVIDEMRLANEDDLARLGLPPSYFGSFLKGDGSLACDYDFSGRNKYYLPRKLRGKDFAEFAKNIVDQWLQLPKSDRRSCFERPEIILRVGRVPQAGEGWGFGLPAPLADLGFFLSLGVSEVFRMVADYMDELKSDRRLAITTQRLEEYDFHLAASRQQPLTWREIQQKYWPDYKGSPQNFQKFLRERGIQFRAVGKWRGESRKCVRQREKNTHPRVCVRMIGDHQSRRERSNAENASHSRK